MTIAGVIAEYDPFHNGHLHHLRETRYLTGCEGLVVCLGGNFTQRGEPAMLSKWTRARMALLCGADAVFELPAPFAVRTADFFARGGVGVLAGLHCDILSFGCETADLKLLETLAELRETEPEALSRGVRARLEAGMSHARARGEAVAEYLGLPAEELNAPNMALAVEYLRCLRGTETRPLVIPRVGDYHGALLAPICSATAVRKALAGGEDVSMAVPAECLPLLPEKPRLPLDAVFLYRLRQGGLSLPDASEGLEGLFTRAARESGTLEEVIERVKSRRYTRARIVRAMAHAAAGLTKEAAAACPRPAYARLLGLRAGAEGVLRELSRRAALPIVSDATRLRGNPCFEAEQRFTDLWALGEPESADRRAGQELTRPFVRVEA